MPHLSKGKVDMGFVVGSLFAGVGGICLGFKQAGCQVLWANEIDSNACKTYKLNHKGVNLIEDSVLNLSKIKLPKIDILTAGFPCQPFSQAGHGKGFDDERGKLFFEIPKLLKQLQPKAYFLENVKTLSSHNDRKTFAKVCDEMRNAGYSFIPFILNASKYSNIPQGRERIYIVGFKGEQDYFFAKPTKVNFIPNFSYKTLSANFKIPNEVKLNKNVAEFLQSNQSLPNDIYCDKNNKIHKKIIEVAKNPNTVYQYRRHYVRENKSNLCPTLTANMGAGGHNVPIILDGEYPRRLTPKECFNLQGFPKDFKLPQDISRGQLYKQAGNSVVVPMVKIIAKEIVRVLQCKKI